MDCDIFILHKPLETAIYCGETFKRKKRNVLMLIEF
jgi:hypothetical protein